MVGAFLASGALADHRWLWGGDGRITAGHLAVLADRTAAGPDLVRRVTGDSLRLGSSG